MGRYAFKEQAHALGAVDPGVAGEELERIAKSRGALTPKVVVEEARAESHPLHNYFEWNDGEAAEKYREHQAAYLIRNVVIRIGDVKAEPVRAFVHVSDSPGQRGGDYRSMGDVLENPELRRQMLQRALRDLAAWSKRYEQLSELSLVRAAAERVQQDMELSQAG